MFFEIRRQTKLPRQLDNRTAVIQEPSVQTITHTHKNKVQDTSLSFGHKSPIDGRLISGVNVTMHTHAADALQNRGREHDSCRQKKCEEREKNKTSSPFSLFQSQISPKAALLPLSLPFSLSRFQYFALFLGKPIMRGGSAQSTLAWV
jgi:hypothetical protein